MTESAKSAYERLKTKREPYLRRAREAAELTLPEFYPPEGWDGGDLGDPSNSIGPEAVGALSAKLLVNLFPPGSPFFKWDLDPRAEQDENADQIEFEKVFGALLAFERAVTSAVETQGMRPVLSEIFTHILLSGQVLCRKEGPGLDQWPLPMFVCTRDLKGEPVHIVLREEVIPEDMPSPELAEHVTGLITTLGASLKRAEMFTEMRLVGSEYLIHQELADGTVVTGVKKYSKEGFPYFIPRFSAKAGKDYSYGYVPQFLGDLVTANALAEALNDSAAAAARLIGLIRPGTTLDVDEIETAPNGRMFEGEEGDVSWVTLGNKTQDFQTTFNRLVDVENRLKSAFLMANFRQAERVTAEELRLQAQELEAKLAGAYSLFSQELQLPLVRLTLLELEREGKIQAIPKEFAVPSIVTGVEALGRTADAFKLSQFLQAAVGTLGEQALMNLDTRNVLSRMAVFQGIEPGDILKDPEQIAQEQQAAQLAQLGQNVAPEIVKGAINNGGQ